MTAIEEELRAKSAVCDCAHASAPIDMAHLDHYTAGDRTLAREVLWLFQEQSATYCAELRCANAQEEWQRLAHTLKGSARGVGAWAVVSAAQTAESLPLECENANRDDALRLIECAVADANQFIENLK
ncbi:MAG: Hpt domain-containing protein [Hyphomicrobiales bacterium]